MSSGDGENPLAAPFLGFIVGSTLFGVTILQCYQYYIRYPNDTVFCKIKVAAVCLLDLLHFVFSADLMYTLLISNSGTTENFWSLKALGTTQGTLIVLVQMIYLQRIYSLSRIPALNTSIFFKFMMVGICSIALCAIGVTTVWCYELIRVNVIFGSDGELRWAIYLGFGTTAILDSIITGLTCFVLYKNRVEIGLDHISQQSNKLLLNLIRYAIATGLITTLASILGTILYLRWPNTLFYLSITFPITRLYANSVLTMLNVRRRLNTDLMSAGASNLSSGLVFKMPTQATSSTHFRSRQNASTCSLGPRQGTSGKTAKNLASLEINSDHDLEAQDPVNLYSPYYSPLATKKQVNELLLVEEPDEMGKEDRIGFWRAKKQTWFGWSPSRRSSL